MKFSPSKIAIAICLLICVWASSNLNWGKDHWRGIVESDAKGYYAYLPATFIYSDLNFGFFDSIEKVKYFDEHYYYDYRASQNNKTINKYYCGTAILQAPFFFASHLITKLTNYDADGFSKLYCFGVNIAALFYLFLGLFYLRKTLSLFLIKEWTQFWVICAITIGTNLFYYSVIEPGMSHVYSFALINAFIYFSKKITLQFSKKELIKLAIILGLIFLVRPINVLVVFSLPFIAGSKSNLVIFLKNLLGNFFITILSASIFIFIIAIQFIIYKISCGSFFVYSYTGEGFNFSSPHMLDILFSYRKGLFLYTPVYLLCLWGLFFIYKKSKWEFVTLISFLVFLVYILSSWWSWWYGGSFSSRPFIEFLPIFAICLALLLNNTKQTIHKPLIGLVILLILFCQVQIYQYRYNQITWDNMTKEKYWDVFLRIDKLLK